jgi:hypothetical protein
MEEKTDREIREGFLDLVRDYDLNDMKEAFAEIAEQYTDLGSELDQLDADLTNLRVRSYIGSMVKFALVDLLKEKNIITEEEFRGKLLEFSEKEKMKRSLGFGSQASSLN